MIALTDDANDFEYDVALTFAGENRSYVEPIAQRLRDAGVRVFYDNFEQGRLWGEDLYVFFDEVFRKKARYAVMFVSAAYAEKYWAAHEAKSAQARSLAQTASPYLLPVRLDDTELPGLRPTLGYIDARETGRDRLVELLLAKLEVPIPVERVPRTPKEEAAVRETRPPAWEYLLFAGILLRRRGELEPKYRDHQLRYRQFAGLHLDEDEARVYLTGIFDEVRGIIDNFNRVLTPESQSRAFGEPGDAGNAEQIEHLAERLMGVYSGLLDWSARLRGAAVPEQYGEVFDIASRFADGPIEQFREFVDRIVAKLDETPRKLAAGEDVSLVLDLTIALKEGQVDAFDAAMGRLRAHYGV